MFTIIPHAPFTASCATSFNVGLQGDSATIPFSTSGTRTEGSSRTGM